MQAFAEVARLSERKVRDPIDRGEVTAYRLGPRTLRIDIDSGDHWLAGQLAIAQATASAEGDPAPAGIVYFVQHGDNGPIKVGWAKSEASVFIRLDALQVGNPVELRLRGWLPGDRTRERELHQRFNAAFVRGEWFEPTDALRALIEEACIAHGDPTAERFRLGARA